jgi:fucose 4-O-acetylase-like acetyltransferase
MLKAIQIFLPPHRDNLHEVSTLTCVLSALKLRCRWDDFCIEEETLVVAAKYFLPVPATSAALQTPDDRDRIIDAARGISLMIVVAGHAVMGIVGWQYGVPKVGNLLAAYPWTQALTWVFQIVPLFFFAGGAANAISWDKHVKRGGSYAEWMWARAQRFLRPIWSYLLIMGFVAAIVTWLAPTRVAAPLMLLTTQLLWFLGSYILVTALTPIFKPATPLQGGIRVLSLLVACGLVDVLRFFQGFPNAVGVANFVLVWMVPGCLGALWAGGTIKRLSRPFLFSVLVFGITINALLIGLGPWPISLVGMPGDPISNMSPPTVVLAIHCVIWVILVALLRKPLTRLLAREKVWRRVTWVNLVAMTLYLWHLPMLVLLISISHFFGMDRPTRLGVNGYPVPEGWNYAIGSIGFWFVFGICVWAIIRLMWPLEHARLPGWDWPSKAIEPKVFIASWASAIGVVGVGTSLLMLSATGLGGFPFRVVDYVNLPLNSAGAMVLLLLSGALIRWAGAPRSER